MTNQLISFKAKLTNLLVIFSNYYLVYLLIHTLFTTLNIELLIT